MAQDTQTTFFVMYLLMLNFAMTLILHKVYLVSVSQLL